MILKDISHKLFPVIKVISIVVITSAIGLELWNIQVLTTNSSLPNILNPILIIAHLALSAHLAEAVIAAYFAPSKKNMPIKYGVYTFFVGTIGLLELLGNNDN